MAWAKGMTPSLLKKTTPVMKDIPPRNSSYIPEGSLWKETVEKKNPVKNNFVILLQLLESI